MKLKSKKQKISFILVAILDVAFLAIVVLEIYHPFIHFGTFQMLAPKGAIARGERQAIIMAVLVMLIIVVPVLAAAVYIARKYRANNNATYEPNWQGTGFLHFLWWAFPCAVIICLGVITWKSSHALDPFKPLSSNVKPITIQVVALEWKWLFIYPEQKIATVNFIEFPAGTPVNFELTADAPMNSFWIPQLGGQMYAMAGMSTQLHLIADSPGEYNGSAAEINGEGFSGMRFVAKSTSSADFNQWIANVQKLSPALNMESYNDLAKPTTDSPPGFYRLDDGYLYNEVMGKYMAPVPDKMLMKSN